MGDKLVPLLTSTVVFIGALRADVMSAFGASEAPFLYTLAAKLTFASLDLGVLEPVVVAILFLASRPYFKFVVVDRNLRWIVATWRRWRWRCTCCRRHGFVDAVGMVA